MAKKVAKDLPYNQEAERAVLGSVFLSKDALLDVVNSLNEEEFYEARNQIIFRCLKNLNEKNLAVDMVTVTEELINMKELENVGGVAYLQECSDSMVALSSLEFYIQIVQNQAILRNLLKTIRNIDEQYHNEEIEDVDDFVTNAKASIDKVLDKRRVSSFQTTGDVVKVVVDKIKKLGDANNPDELLGLTTGYERLNNLTQGFKNDEMIIVAARPSVGKTALCLNFAHRAATKSKKAVGIFSLEMSRELLCQRLLALSSCVSLKHITTGHLTSNERSSLNGAINELEAAKIYIDDSPGLRLQDIITKSKKLQAREPNLGLLIIDYLGLVQTAQGNRNGDSRQEEVRKISLALKQLARDLKIPIVVVSQLSRSVEQRDSKKPMMSDLRDSGNIEQDADIVMLLYREDYYDKKEANLAANKKGGALTNAEKFELAKEAKQKALGQEIPGNASYVEVNVAKNRNGQTGKCGLFFFKEFGRFDQPSAEWEEAMQKVENDAYND